jgi:hypothetical protein
VAAFKAQREGNESRHHIGNFGQENQNVSQKGGLSGLCSYENFLTVQVWRVNLYIHARPLSYTLCMSNKPTLNRFNCQIISERTFKFADFTINAAQNSADFYNSCIFVQMVLLVLHRTFIHFHHKCYEFMNKFGYQNTE